MVKTRSAPQAIRSIEWGSSSAPLAATALEHALISVAEQEQERIGRELHDGLGQELAGAAFLAKALAGKLASLDPAVASDAEWIKIILGRCLEGVRHLSRQLSPTDLAQGNAIAALERLCADVERSYGVSCCLTVDEGVQALCDRASADDTRQLFRICQEALNNATRHSACRRVRVRLSRRGQAVRLAISDDGEGFAQGARRPPSSSGVGITSMNLRARSLDGCIRITRRTGWTHVLLRAPCGVRPSGELSG